MKLKEQKKHQQLLMMLQSGIRKQSTLQLQDAEDGELKLPTNSVFKRRARSIAVPSLTQSVKGEHVQHIPKPIVSELMKAKAVIARERKEDEEQHRLDKKET